MLPTCDRLISRMCVFGKRLGVLIMSVLLVVGASCRAKEASPAHSERELALLSGLNIPGGLDLLTIAKKKASEEMGVPQSDLSVEGVTHEGTGDSSRWEVFVEQQPAIPGGHCIVFISNEGKILDYWPGE